MSDRRVRLRRRLLVLGVLPLLLALALGVRVGVMLGLDDRGRSAFGAGEFEHASEAFAANGRLNVFEPWVAPFDEGTADYRLADFATARGLFEEALLDVPDERQCVVRINLSLTLEALGDAGLADSRRDLAEAFWREGIAVLDEGSCRARASDADADREAETAAALSVATRLAEKLADRASVSDAPQVEDPDPPTLEELDERNEEAQEQRRRNEETREDEPPPDPTPPPDDPSQPDDPSPPTPSAPPSYSW